VEILDPFLYRGWFLFFGFFGFAMDRLEKKNPTMHMKKSYPLGRLVLLQREIDTRLDGDPLDSVYSKSDPWCNCYALSVNIFNKLGLD